MHDLEPLAESTLRLITQLSAVNSKHLSRMVQFMSGLAQRCNRRHLYSVAECLVLQMEYVSQLAWQIITARGTDLRQALECVF